MLFLSWAKLLHRWVNPRPRAIRKGHNKMHKNAAFLRVEELENRTVPAPVTPTGALGALHPSYSVVFDTTAGTYQVDGGSVQSGGVLSPILARLPCFTISRVSLSEVV